MAPAPPRPALPAPVVAPVTPEARLAYVLRHFRLAYEQVPAVTIGYPAAQPAITVTNGAGGFFDRPAPYPPAPNFREWGGQSVPFFFDAHPKAALLELREDQATINADVIAASFYLLSGWQEYFSEARDQHGRFPYAASVQRQYGFVALPVVNHYFDVLKTAVEHVTGRPLRPRRWAGQPFAAFITHDIDNLHGGWATAVRHALRRGRLTRAATLLVARVRSQPAPWNNLEHVQAETARFGAPSTFFILADNRPAPYGPANADYTADAPAFLNRLATLAATGAEIAGHGSYGTAENPGRLREERKRLQPLGPAGNRFHYLCWEPTRTPETLALAGVTYDSTLGFAEHFGFRNSYCQPFFPFDFPRGRAHSFLEIPLNVMDVTLHHPSYLRLRPEEIMPALRPVLAEIARFGGVATVLWHNANFDPANEATGPRQFDELMRELRQRGAAFLTGTQIVRHLCE
ncbi:DUF7033 domain-containing protein [Hymenobacter sp.]|uniref:DUF7033 domain-containing protein n=1 Tax=Hymenobacter sp. TaxID=1898978 RepID=UPI00286B61B5|nr:hypothetical protein [Hymenobacter sp.]